jgi:hypothetical protein
MKCTIYCRTANQGETLQTNVRQSFVQYGEVKMLNFESGNPSLLSYLNLEDH